MILVSVMYPGGSGTRFDMDYYLRKHMPLVDERWSGKGLQGYEVVRGVATPEGAAPPFQVIALLRFDSAEAFAAAAKAHGAELFGDIPNFTDVQPAVQISEIAQAP